MSVVVLVNAPSLVNDEVVTAYISDDGNTEIVNGISKEVKVEMNKNEDGIVKAVVTTVTTKNGKESITYETFKGTESEVRASINALGRITKSLKVALWKMTVLRGFKIRPKHFLR